MKRIRRAVRDNREVFDRLILESTSDYLMTSNDEFEKYIVLYIKDNKNYYVDRLLHSLIEVDNEGDKIRRSK